LSDGPKFQQVSSSHHPTPSIEISNQFDQRFFQYHLETILKMAAMAAILVESDGPEIQ
jgi:hypothetical protein